jgi:hypothetical protein
LSQFHPFVFVWEQFVVVEFFILLDMGGGASHAFHHLIGEHSLNEDQQQHYHNEYKALEATGMEEPQIIDELRNRLKNKMGSNNSMDGGSSRSTRIKGKPASTSAPATAATSNAGSSRSRRGSRDSLPTSSSRPTSGETSVKSRGNSEKSTRSRKSVDDGQSCRVAATVAPPQTSDPGTEVTFAGPQPYKCEFCKTGYPTFSFFESHIRISAQHATSAREKEQAKKKEAADANSAVLAQNEAVSAALALAAAVENEEVDSEAVVNDYVCEVCSITFASFTLLDRHIRFSDRHVACIRERDKREEQEQRAKKIAKSTHNYLHFLRNFVVSKPKQDEHSLARKRWHMAYKRVKMDNAIKKTEKQLLDFYRHNKKEEAFQKQPLQMFRATKMFWRSQETFNLNLFIFHHENEKTKAASPGAGGVIEVVAFAMQDKEFEYSTRLYLDFTAVCSLVKKELKVAIGKLKKKSQKTRRRSFQSPLVAGSEYSTDDKLDDCEVNNVIGDIVGTLILDKLLVERIPGSAQRLRFLFKVNNAASGTGVNGNGDAAPPAQQLENSKSDSVLNRSSSGSNAFGAEFVLDEAFALTILSPVIVSEVKVKKVGEGVIEEMGRELAAITNRAEKIMNLVSSGLNQVQDLAVSSTQRAKLAYGTVIASQDRVSPRKSPRVVPRGQSTSDSNA